MARLGNRGVRSRRALITGGDSGIGRAAAIAYAREGADVAIDYHPDEQPDADEVVALIAEEGRRAVALPGDLREEAFCTRLVAHAVAQLGGLDILVLNAARHQARESILEVTAEEFAATLKTNVYAPFWIAKAANMNAAKSLAKMLGPKGVRVNGVAPGPVWTPLQTSGGASEEKYRRIGSSELGFTTGSVYGAAGGQGQP